MSHLSRVVLLGCVAVVLLLLVVQGRDAHAPLGNRIYNSNNHPNGPSLLEPSEVFSLSQSKILRWKQRLLHHKQVKQQQQQQQRMGLATTSGTLFRLGMPTSQQQQQLTLSTNALFNHDMAGMTNPCFGIRDSSLLLRTVVPAMDGSSSSTLSSSSSSYTEREQASLNYPTTTTATTTATTASSSSSSSSSLSSAWFPPGTACPIDTSQWRMIRLRQCVGTTEQVYTKVRDAVLQWEFASSTKGIVKLETPSNMKHDSRQQGRRNTSKSVWSRRPYTIVPLTEDVSHPCFDPNHVLQIWSGPGRRLLTYTKMLPHLFCVNPVSVVYDVVDQPSPAPTTSRYTSTAYATGPGHWLRGEERVTVALRTNGHVDVEILSYSQPSSHWIGRLIWPVVGKMQQTFFQDQMKSLQDMAQQEQSCIQPQEPWES